MQRTTSVNLGGIPFVANDDAYLRLQRYLEEIGVYFRSLGGGEVVVDIEERLAEQLQARLTEGHRQVVDLADVEAMIKAMGTVADISGESFAQPPKDQADGEGSDPKSPRTRFRRLYRDPDDMIIAGVCSGIAAHFGIDPLLVRLGFVATVFFGGAGIIAYVLLWILVPPAVTPAEKMEMRGENATLEDWRERLQEKAGRVGLTGSRFNGAVQRVARAFDRLFRALGFVLRRLGALFIALVGFGLIAAGLCAALGVAFFVATLLGPQSSFYYDFPLPSLIPVWLLTVLLFATAWLALAPLLGMMLTGVTLMRRRSAFRLMPTMALIGTWVLAGLTLAFGVMQVAPTYRNAVIEAQAVENLSAATDVSEPFRAVTVSNVQRLTVERGPEVRAVLSGSRSALERRRLAVRDGRLIIENVLPHRRACIFCLPSRDVAQLTVTVPALDDLDVSMAREVVVKGFEGDKFKVTAANLDRLSMADLKISDLDLKLHDVDDATLAGTGKSATMTVSTNGRTALQAFSFPVEDLTLNLSDDVRASVSASKTLKVVSDGRAAVSLRGQAKVTESLLPSQEDADVPGSDADEDAGEDEPKEVTVTVDGESRKVNMQMIEGPDGEVIGKIVSPRRDGGRTTPTDGSVVRRVE